MNETLIATSWATAKTLQAVASKYDLKEDEVLKFAQKQMIMFLAEYKNLEDGENIL